MKKIMLCMVVLLLLVATCFLGKKHGLYVIDLKGNLEAQMFSFLGQMGYVDKYGKDVCLVRENVAFVLPYRLCTKKEVSKAKLKKCKFKNFDDVMENSDCSYLRGRVFEDKRFFEKGVRHIKSAFKFKKFDDEKIQKLEKKITSTNSVAVHIKIGDHMNRGLPVMPPRYYYRAFDYVQAREEEPIHLFIFSDNIKEVRDTLKTEYPVTFVKGNSKEADMYLMSLCRHNIISNSPYSWWAAYLNENPNKIVVRPDVWGKNNVQRLYKELAPKEWFPMERSLDEGKSQTQKK